MYTRIGNCLNHPSYFRYGFYFLLLISLVLNSVITQNDSNFYILYILAAVFLGIGFYNKPAWFIIFFTVLVVVCRFFLIPDFDPSIINFLVYLVTYLLITFISLELMKYVQKVKESQVELTMALANTLDSRDAYTLHHSENVAKYAVKIAEEMKLSKHLCEHIRIGCLLHDIGKIGIPERILNKKEKLTIDEYNVIKNHPTIGYNIIKHVATFNQNGVLDIVLHHHERYDGTGYPEGLKGDEIPLAARIVAVADSFDAMTSKRIYRDELEMEHTINEICKNKGTQFDPEVVDVFFNLLQTNGYKI
ncbi:HD-GYP domain-containing protein [Fredinandcohnia humi]